MMEEYLEDIKKAIRNVDKNYYSWKDWCLMMKNTNSQSLSDELICMKESVFCYEFYHQFRMLMEKDQKYEGLFLNAEITKKELDDVKNKIKYPDFVLHSGQDNNNVHKFVIEVKTSEYIKANAPENNINSDIVKLLDFIKKNGLKYEFGVFIAVNMSNKDLKEKINFNLINKKTNKDDANYEKIILIGTEFTDEENFYFTLNELDNEIKTNKE